jgi:hypothetical protein
MFARAYLDLRAIRNEPPDLIHLLVGDGNAALGPILQAMRASQTSVAVGQAVDHDVASGRRARLPRPGAIVGIRARNVKRAVELAVLVSAVDQVDSFRSFMVALTRLGTDRDGAQRNLVFAEGLPVPEKLQCVLSAYIAASCCPNAGFVNNQTPTSTTQGAGKGFPADRGI